MKLAFALVMLLAGALAVTANYNVVVAENGNSLVAIALSGQGEVSVPLPIDATPTVSGALYVNTANGIDLTVSSSGTANVLYQSSTLTEKGESWQFSLELSDAAKNSVTLSLPSSATVGTTTPKAEIANVGGSTNVIWGSAAGTVGAEYSFGGTPAAPPKRESADNGWLLYLIVAIAIIAAVAAWLRLKKKARDKVLNTLSGNERKVMHLLAESGGMRRNELEHKSGLAKSSLASTLAQLEKRNLAVVDRGNTVHFVRPSDWFNSL